MPFSSVGFSPKSQNVAIYGASTKFVFLVLISHVFMDLFTSYGTMVFAPFSDHRYAWDLTFIVDLIFSGILFIPWMISLFWRRRAAWICRGSLMLLTVYVLFCAVQHHRAINVTKTVRRESKRGSSTNSVPPSAPLSVSVVQLRRDSRNRLSGIRRFSRERIAFAQKSGHRG